MIYSTSYCPKAVQLYLSFGTYQKIFGKMSVFFVQTVEVKVVLDHWPPLCGQKQFISKYLWNERRVSKTVIINILIKKKKPKQPHPITILLTILKKYLILDCTILDNVWHYVLLALLVLYCLLEMNCFICKSLWIKASVFVPKISILILISLRSHWSIHSERKIQRIWT